ncbi:MAG TPA: ImmA/IrrE family metallo-endopeptidase [Bacillus bacterium]|uniref:ImmA/IrrE family metallo-endopeptidase n=1 Tax=Siminovitchia fordii TaxID=254759 RepID=UPI00035FE193|nr:ImmA/IrrE family metallo-endopeptidase [Siminovitchia fordii]HBZ09159.1 ImmA/IrrE family metallo-endopeptidase [Bacillus sp. (in: firmicutes)]
MQLDKKYNFDYWEERAYRVLSHFNYTYPDEIDMYDICWRYGIQIKPLELPFMDESVAYESISHLKALSIPKNKGRRGTIYLKPGLRPIEKKLILAEEFCHLYSHCQSQLSEDPYQIAKTENQAKRMAAYLLMPEHFLKTVFNVAIEEAVLISDIADFFVVTEEFVQYRMNLTYNKKMDALLYANGKLGTFEWID